MYKDINDPRDPWAWRNQWTGEARTDYAELWVVIPLCVGLVFVALMMLLPLFIYKYCRTACPCQSLCHFFDGFLSVLHEIGKEKDLKQNRLQLSNKKPGNLQCFENPAFDAPQIYNTENSNKKNIRCAYRSNCRKDLYKSKSLLTKTNFYPSKEKKKKKQINKSKLYSIYKRGPYIPKIRL